MTDLLTSKRFVVVIVTIVVWAGTIVLSFLKNDFTFVKELTVPIIGVVISYIGAQTVTQYKEDSVKQQSEVIPPNVG